MSSQEDTLWKKSDQILHWIYASSSLNDNTYDYEMETMKDSWYSGETFPSSDRYENEQNQDHICEC